MPVAAPRVHELLVSRPTEAGAHLENLAGGLQLPRHAADCEHDAGLVACRGRRPGGGLVNWWVQPAMLLAGVCGRLLLLLLLLLCCRCIHNIDGQLPPCQQTLLAIRYLQ